MAIILKEKDTGRIPALALLGMLDYGQERELRQSGGVFRRKSPDESDLSFKNRAHWEIPAPCITKALQDVTFLMDWESYVLPEDFDPETATEIPQHLKIMECTEAVEFINRWKQYEADLKSIKENDEVLINQILHRHGVVNGEFFIRPPLPHQKAGLAFFLLSMEINGGHILLFDEMRTGKTKQAIDIARFCLNNRLVSGALIICPNTIKRVWKNEINVDAGTMGMFSTIIGGTKYEKQQQWESRNLFYIVNYEGCRADYEYLKAWEARMNSLDGFILIMDEEHKVKNPEAKQTKAIMSLNPKFSVGMTGTPVANRPEDAFCMADFASPGCLGQNYFYFQQQFGVRGGYQGRQIVGYRDLDEVKRRLARLSLRRRRQDIIFDQTIRTERYGTMSGQQAKCYEDMRDLLIAEITNHEGEYTSVSARNTLVKILRLQQITSGYLPKPKIDDPESILELLMQGQDDSRGDVVWFDDNWKLSELDSFIDEYLDELGKLVIWSRFVPPIYMLAERYQRHGSVFIKGQMGEQAIDNMYQFQQDPATKIMIAQIQTSEGKGFQPATVCIFWDKWWSPHLNRQAEDRIVGIKNPVPVTVVSLITEDSIDERLEFMLSKKREWADSITGDIRTDVVIPKLGKSDLLYLLANPEEARKYEQQYSDNK